eukprot:TRINITY_DN4496_c0_g1_i1.p1 TRINITY_DN4496_c0_g1~~TRINITY_DN4496_c0_g1_i1.p1  ORF type:complete len:295 (+),score=90.82 TRINITY_DN4496_c0_g1_i1:6-890(+)
MWNLRRSLFLLVLVFAINTLVNLLRTPKVISKWHVPNEINFVHFDAPELPFVSVICILAAYFNGKPDLIRFHSNLPLDVIQNWKHWDVLEATLGDKLVVNHLRRPTHVFGTPIRSPYHAADLSKLQILRTRGGIALDQDVFIVQPLEPFLEEEFTLGWAPNEYIGSQILLADKKSRFLKAWIASYKDYRPDNWYYNAGELPTKSILLKNPTLVHRVLYKFGVSNLSKELYDEYWPHWRDFYSIHLLWAHRSYLAKGDVERSGIREFNEENISGYNNTFGEMARSVWVRRSIPIK